MLADQGDRVTKGQLLATLDDGDLRQQVEMAKADLAATKAGVDRAAAEIASAEATVTPTPGFVISRGATGSQELVPAPRI